MTLLKRRSNPEVEAVGRELDAAVLRGNALAQARSFIQAKKEIEAFSVRLDTVERNVPLFEDYKVARDKAQQLIDGLKNHKSTAVVAPLLAMIEAKFGRAVAVAGQYAYAAAETSMNEIIANCNDAKLAADSHTEFAALGAGGGTADTSQLEAAINKVKDKIVLLQTPPVDETLAKAIIDGRTKIADAEKLVGGNEGDRQKAAGLIDLSSKDCTQAEVYAQQFGQIKQQIATALGLVTGFVNGGHAAKAFVAERMAATSKAIEGARRIMTMEGSAAASKALVDATAKFNADVLLADKRAEYNTARLALEPAGGTSVLQTLEASPQRYAATDDIEALRTHLAAAAVAADAAEPDFAKAMAELKLAEAAAAARPAGDLDAGGCRGAVER